MGAISLAKARVGSAGDDSTRLVGGSLGVAIIGTRPRGRAAVRPGWLIGGDPGGPLSQADARRLGLDATGDAAALNRLEITTPRETRQ